MQHQQDLALVCRTTTWSVNMWILHESSSASKLHASQQKSLMEQPWVWKVAWIRETEEHNYSLWPTVSFFQLNQTWSIFKYSHESDFYMETKQHSYACMKSFRVHIQPLQPLSNASKTLDTVDITRQISYSQFPFKVCHTWSNNRSRNYVHFFYYQQVSIFGAQCRQLNE